MKLLKIKILHTIQLSRLCHMIYEIIWHGQDINSQIVKAVKPEFEVGDMMGINI